MIMLSTGSALRLNILNDSASGNAKGLIDLPSDLAAQPNDLYDRVFAFAFDVLGLQTVELRVRPDSGGARLLATSGGLPYRERSA